MIAAVFPGQGSQKPGMGKELFDAFGEARAVFAEVATATDMKVEWICFEAPEDTLRQTQNAQIALFATSVAAWRSLLGRASIEPQGMAGHSVGEYAALVCSGALTLSDGARLVKTRGYLMAEAGESHPGTMAAVLGLEREELEAICEQAGGVVVVANDNCPGQLVISGDAESVARAGALSSEAGAKRVLPLNVSGAFHSPLMRGPSERMAEALEGVAFAAESVPVYANVTAEPMTDMERWPRLLEEQLRSPVRWTETIQNMRRDGITTFIESGSGEVLSGLIRRIDKEARTMRVGDPTTLEETVEGLA